MRALISGASGAVGQEILRLIEADPRFELGGTANRTSFFRPEDQGDVLIDFSHSALTLRSIDLAEQRHIPIVIGTTGLSDACQERVEQVSDQVAVCQAANFSVGVTVMFELAARAAAALPDSFDVEIAEAHHRRKLDAPSGTALTLGRVIAESRDQSLSGISVLDRSDRRTARKRGEIGFQVTRGGDVVGEHTAQFLGDGERLDITHRASDRSIFARGALLAAGKLLKRGAGKVDFAELILGQVGGA